jgi:hypothetical protein
MNSGSFPTVGDSVLSYVGSGACAKKSKYTKLVAKETMGKGKSPTGKAAIRGSSKINEANGPKCQVVAKLYKANAADAGMQTRNIRIMPSCCGVSDFAKARTEAGSVY